ncbi:MAG: pyridoxal phosphate-dependent aminotransferase [Alphaproteobacteria bacterium]
MSTLKTSNRSNINVFKALDILRQVNERESQGADIRRMGAGQPCFGAPQAALDYAIETIQKDPRQGYTEAIGMPSLRERITEYYKNYYGVEISPANIVITAGSSSAFILDFIAAFDNGDKVATITPTYPAYRNILKSLNLQNIEIESRAEDNYQPTLDLLQNCGQNFDGLIINSPSNPGGTMINETELEKICNWCDEKGIRLISDEAYHGITYEKKAVTARKFSKTAIILNTFSKYFAMTGWRLGWTVLPDDLVDPVKKLSENLFVSAPTIAQHVAYKIFDHLDVLDGYVARYRINRDILMKELPKIGITDFTNGAGAFYIYADIHNLSNNSENFCTTMLDEALVSTTPGLDFDLTRGHKSIRICYADSEENIIEACKRLKNWQS